MRAAGFVRFGGPDVVRTIDLPRPDALAGDVLVRVRASTINPTDLLMRRGAQAAMMASAPPFVGGFEFSGEIAAVPSTGSRFLIGDRVAGALDARRAARGAHAEFVSVPDRSLAAIGPAVDDALAAVTPLNGLTAVLALEALALPAGSSLLVTGGGGVLAGFLIPLAKRCGLVVVADAAASDASRVRSLGADHVAPRGPDFAGSIQSAFPSGVDGAIDTALVGDAAWNLVRDGGGALAVRRSHLCRDPRLMPSCVSFLDGLGRGCQVGRLLRLVEEGLLAPRVAYEMPAGQAAAAHALAEGGGLQGRIVLRMDQW